MAIACSTSAFKVQLAEALKEVAELGFDYVDLIAIPGWDHVQPEALADDFESVAGEVERLLQENDLTPVAVNMAVPHTHQRDEETNIERLRQVRGVARLMERLDVDVASFYPGYKAEDRPWDEVLADSATTMREMLGVAAEIGVTLAVELHYNTPFETVEQCTRLLEAVPELPVAYDPSHFAMQGLDLDDTSLLMERAAHVHLRDAAPDEMFVPLGRGTVDFDRLIEMLQERGYTGHYSIEYLGLHEGAREEIVKLRNRVAAHLGQ
jgi:sugar phosphate isomerase/epimerase